MRVATFLSFIVVILLVSCNPTTHDTLLDLVPSSTPDQHDTLIPTFTITNTKEPTNTQTPSPKNIVNYFCTWIITGYENPYHFSFPTDEFSDAQIGKKMEMTSSEVHFDNEFLWLNNNECSNVTYRWLTENDFSGKAWQIVLPSRNPDKRDDFLFFDISCDGNSTITYEVTKSGRLVVYLSGHWFFLEPEVKAVSVLATRNASTSTNTPTPEPSSTNTATFLPTYTPGPGTIIPSATKTPTDLELLDERTQFLFGEPASVGIDFFHDVQKYIRTSNKEKLASLILYPITIHTINGKDVEIQNEEDFISNYNAIATPKWREIILTQKPAELFTNMYGFMVNQGEMWFGPICIDGSECQQTKYYIFGITNDTPW